MTELRPEKRVEDYTDEDIAERVASEQRRAAGRHFYYDEYPGVDIEMGDQRPWLRGNLSDWIDEIEDDYLDSCAQYGGKGRQGQTRQAALAEMVRHARTDLTRAIRLLESEEDPSLGLLHGYLRNATYYTGDAFRPIEAANERAKAFNKETREREDRAWAEQEAARRQTPEWAEQETARLRSLRTYFRNGPVVTHHRADG